MEAIKNTVTDIMQRWAARKTQCHEFTPGVFLNKVLTKKELEHIRFNYFKKGVLELYVDSSAWLYSLSLQKKDLLARLNKKSSAVKDIRFRIGDIK